MFNYGEFSRQKTFGGKIWRNLHSVSPSNYFGKNLNKGSLEISRQKLCKQHLVQKNENWTPIFLSCLKTLKISFWFFQISTLCTKCCVLNEKALWQATEANKKTKLTEFLSVMGNLLSIFAFVFNQIF